MTQDRSSRSEADRYLIERIREGDEDSFRQLVDRFTGRLKAFAARKLGARSAEAEDAVQETFLGLLENIGRLPPLRSLEAYLFTILRNKLIDFARRTPRGHGLTAIPLGMTDSRPGYEPVAAGTSPSHYAKQVEKDAVRRQVLADILGEALGMLKEEKNFRDLKVLELLFNCGMKGKEAAEIAGTSEPTVTRTRQEAIERLGRAARRHPKFDSTLVFFGPGEDPTGLVSDVWRENLLSCLKRSTLGAYALGAIEPEWRDYVAFHLETVRCETCAANLDDLRAGESAGKPAGERVFASSVGFLKGRKK